MADEVLTIKEAAALLKLAEKTVYTMAQSGEIPAFKIRGQWRITRWTPSRAVLNHDPGRAIARQEVAARRVREGTLHQEGVRSSTRYRRP